jgi:pyruvate dehydrogenase E2 component (dihydrolipoamide acetyltransferase)
MATFEFKLPDLGEGVMEGEIVKWHVKVGDVIAEDTTVLEVMTDKATVTVPTPKAGKVLKLYGAEGEMARVHHRLADLEVADGAAATATKPSHGAAPSAPVAAAAAAAAPAAVSNGEKVLATPVTRRMAAEHHLDLSQVHGTGPQGRVLKSDVEAYLSSSSPTKPAAVAVTRVSPAPSQPLSSSAADQRVPMRGMRKKIAEKMVKSKFTAPHYAFVEEVDATALVGLRNTLNARLAGEGVKLSFLPFFVKAVLAAFKKFPQVNANMDEATQDLIIRGERNLGIAAMTDQGLTVPVIRNADRHSLRSLGNEINRLATAAREQKLKLEELSAGTFTITSLGQTGGLFATPIINHPEVAIMGVHRMRKRPVVTDDDKIVIKPIMLFSFCFDHRVIDGATGAEFAYEVIRFVEQPELLLVDM